LIKNGGQQLKARLHKPILNMWNKETIPDEWLEGIIFPSHKKGGRKLCSSYRPIILLNVAHKIFTILEQNSKSRDRRLSEGFQTHPRDTTNTRKVS
jgi:hypothetical protein